MRYSIDVGGISDVTRAVAREMDDASTAIVAALAAVDTSYSHQSYTDFLSVAQDLDLVGGGQNPDVSEDLDSTIYPREGDGTIVFSTGSRYPGYLPTPGARLAVADPDALLDNHNLIATRSTDNIEVLQQIEYRLEAGVR